jgi:hypothetical protein
MMINQIVLHVILHTHKQTKRIVSIDMMTCIVVFVLGWTVGHAIAVGTP